MSSNQPPWGGSGVPGFGAPPPSQPQPTGAPPASAYGPQPGPTGAPPGAPPVPYGVPQPGPYTPPPAYAAPPAYTPPPAYGAPPAQYGSPPVPDNDPYAAFVRSNLGATASPGAYQAPYGNPYAQPGQSDPYAAYAATPNGAPGGQPVGGWLLFLCVSMTILNPLMVVSRLAPAFSYLSSLGPRFVIEVLIALGLAGFGIYAGIGLWTVRAGAVKIAKMFFVARGAWTVISILMAFTGSYARFALMPQSFVTLLFCAIWYAYLSSANRVKTTYG